MTRSTNSLKIIRRTIFPILINMVNIKSFFRSFIFRYPTNFASFFSVFNIHGMTASIIGIITASHSTIRISTCHLFDRLRAFHRIVESVSKFSKTAFGTEFILGNAGGYFNMSRFRMIKLFRSAKITNNRRQIHTSMIAYGR